MKRQACMLLCAGLLALGAGALAQTATYVFPYEGFRYTQREDETVLTQTNLGEHEALLKSLGTSSEAVQMCIRDSSWACCSTPAR